MDSKMVITGDLRQSDLKRNGQGTTYNGLYEFMCNLKNTQVGSEEVNDTVSINEIQPQQEGGQDESCLIKLIELNVNDVQRSPVVRKILHVYGIAE